MDDDDILGSFVWNDACGSWDCSVAISSNTNVEISLIPLQKDVKPLVEHAREFVLEFRDFDKKLRRAAVESLLDDCNEWWNEGEKQISADEFLAKMSLDGVDFLPDGKAEASYFDGDLFGGHLIVVPFTRDGVIEEAYIQG